MHLNHASGARIVIVATISTPPVIIAVVNIVATGQSLAAIHAIRSPVTVVAATNQVSTAIIVAIAVAFSFIALIAVGAAGPVVVVWVATYNKTCYINSTHHTYQTLDVTLFAAVHPISASPAVVVAADQAAAAVGVPVAVSLALVAAVVVGTAAHVIGVGAAVPGAGVGVAVGGFCSGCWASWTCRAST